MDDELLRDGARVVVCCTGADGRGSRLSGDASCFTRYPRPGACGLHRMAQLGDVRGAVSVRAGPRGKAAVFGEVGFAGAWPADRRSRRAARGLPGIGRPASRLALAPSGRRGPADRRVRPGRCRSRVDGMAAAGGSRTFRSGWASFALCHRSLRRDLRVCACGLGGIGRRKALDSRRSAARDRWARRLADVDGHGGELPAALHVHALTRCRRPEEQYDIGGRRARHRRCGGRRSSRNLAALRIERRVACGRRARPGDDRSVWARRDRNLWRTQAAAARAQHEDGGAVLCQSRRGGVAWYGCSS